MPDIEMLPINNQASAAGSSASPSAAAVSSSSLASLNSRVAQATTTTLALLPEAEDHSPAPLSGARVRKVRNDDDSFPPLMRRVGNGSICTRVEVVLSDAEKEIIKNSYNDTLDLVKEKLHGKLSLLELDNITISIDYEKCIVTVFSKENNQKIDQIALEEIPGAAKIKELLESKNIHLPFGEFSSDSAIGPYGAGLDGEISRPLRGMSFDELVPYMFPKLDCRVGDSFLEKYNQNYGQLALDIKSGLSRSVDDSINELNRRKAADPRIRGKKEELTQLKTDLANAKASSEANAPALVARYEREIKDLETEIGRLEGNFAGNDELIHLQEIQRELGQLDYFALQMVFLAIMSFKTESTNYPNYYREGERCVSYDLSDPDHLTKAAKFIRAQVEHGIAENDSKLAGLIGQINRLFKSKKFLTAQDKEYAARVALLIAPDRCEAASIAEALNIALPPASIEGSIIREVLRSSSMSIASPDHRMAKEAYVERAITRILNERVEAAKKAATRNRADASSSDRGTYATLPGASSAASSEASAGALADRAVAASSSSSSGSSAVYSTSAAMPGAPGSVYATDGESQSCSVSSS